MKEAKIVIGAVSTNPVTMTMSDPYWEMYEHVIISDGGLELEGVFEVRKVEEKGNTKTYSLMILPN